MKLSYMQKMKAKPFAIETGKMIALMHEVDAKELGVLALDRVELLNRKKRKRIATVVDLTNSMVKVDEIGLFADLSRELKVRKGDTLEVRPFPQPESVKFIRKKLEGQRLSFKEIKAIVEDIGANKLNEIEASAFMSAVFVHGFNLNETVSMTRALIEDGKRIRFGKKMVLDKHSIGGINGRTTMVLVPIIASAGYLMPKTSSRSITSGAGTADAMEVLARVDLSLKEIKKNVKRHGAVMTWGGALDLAPVDDKIIKIEHPLGLDPSGQVIASVMAKKASVGATHVVIDIPVGKNVKVKNQRDAKEMERKFIAVGKRLGIKVKVMVTNGNVPVGNAFGPALEARHVLETLEGKTFGNLAEKSCALAGALFELAGKTRKGKGKKFAEEILRSGKALKKMKEIIHAQKGKVFSSKQVRLGRLKHCVKAKKGGRIKKLNVHFFNQIARMAGAPWDKKAGVLLKAAWEGASVKKGDCLFEIHAENPRKLALAKKLAKEIRVIEFGKR